MTAASDAYIKSLTKKKKLEADLSGSDVLPRAGLGAVMMEHGEELGDGSTYGKLTLTSCRFRLQRAAVISIAHFD